MGHVNSLVRRLRSVWLVALTISVSLMAGPATATVTQVDGTLLPVTDRLQIAIDGREPGAAGTISVIRDASELPEFFRPNLSGSVVFRDFAETAGYENSFGWYNVGDDVLTATGRAANLFPIMGCGTPMVLGGASTTTHGGNPAYYVRVAEPGSEVSVNFANERTAGRYKGGFIGFYLITPEGSPSSINCGDFKVDSGGASLLGRIYFTQKDLNDDGDFVHHLVYTSRSVTDRFYFGFEDLFRGGDNDFEDMAMEVTGLTPPCVPQAEVCDGIDNDCDGLIDALDPNLGDTGASCTCDGVGLACTNGPRQGQCQSGATVCVAGVIACQGIGTSSAETCDGTDENCNGVVDESPSGTGASCDGADADACSEGTMVCTQGALVCSDTTGENVEVCNGMDDDCDGTIDDGNPGGGGSCGSTIGACSPGVYACQGGGLVCVGGNAASAELCNGLDDDCDGVVDDAPTDVGVACGSSNVPECAFGMTVCTAGTLVCAGEIGPSPESCDGLDNDCDGTVDDSPVDTGQPCGQSLGACEPGAYVCAMGGLVCSGGQGPIAETCNGIDDDCDGVVDDEVPGAGEACNAGGTGACATGENQCISGAMVCVGGNAGGTETCNDIDDDCDGVIDDGDLCAGGVCDQGTCAAPCSGSEFPCPGGQRCVDNYCVTDPCAAVSCPPAQDGSSQTCVEGACVAVCSLVTCPGDLACRGSDGACVPATCDYLPLCAVGQLCIDSVCAADLCLGVTCAAGEFCRGGDCVASCEGVSCGSGEICRDGACVASGCSSACASSVCDPVRGECVPSQCAGIACAPTKICDPLTGECVADPCLGVDCPGTQSCSAGQCGQVNTGNLVTVGGGGCNAGGGAAIPFAMLLLAVTIWLARRRRGVAALAITVVATLTGCEVNEYCVGCELAGSDANDGGAAGADGGDGGAVGCDPNVILPESCNLRDDDCDGMVDETYDLDEDEQNCGGCGVTCNKPGAQTRCGTGACEIAGCFPGFIDLDGDLSGPYTDSNGCELVCFSSNGGVEACDGLDNNCNGVIDEGIDLSDDSNNCGVCGRTCDLFQAASACVGGDCVFNPASDCVVGFYDRDGMVENGCEYACVPSGGELCDLVDNDCDGVVDDGFNLNTDAANCGSCGRRCQFANATSHCALRTCEFNPSTDCLPGFVDVNGRQLDGCEYACTPTGGGIETCDGVDNDCDGVADDSPVDVGAMCAATGVAVGACVADGVVTCAAGVLVCAGATTSVAETCDNVDNDCDAQIDDGVSRSCYAGPSGTLGVGRCRAGAETCAAGVFGSCLGALEPRAEICDNVDDDCDAAIDEDATGLPLEESCYGGPSATEGVGLCVAGQRTCVFGAYGSCVGEVLPLAVDRCGDAQDSDCDGNGDQSEGCLDEDIETRLDAPGGGLGTAAGAQHSYDLVFGAGGVPLGSRLYAAWSERVGTATEVYLRISSDGGLSWGDIVNVTSGVAATAVKPMIAVAPGMVDRVVVAFQTVSGGVRDIIVRSSSDSGGAFAAATGPLDSSGDSFHHSIAVLGTTVVVTWERLNTSTLNRDIISRTSTDGGSGFAAEQTINVGSGSTRFAGRPQVALTTGGRVVWAWREQRSGGTRDIFAASAVVGVAPSEDRRIDGDTTDRRDSDFPILRAVGDRAYLVWQDVSTLSSGGADAMFAASLDGGASWQSERILDDPTSEISSSFTPTIAVDARSATGTDDFIAVAWEDRREGAQIYASVSSDGGATFGAPIRVSSEAGEPATGESSGPQLASAGDGVLAVIYENRLTAELPRAFLATSIDAGATWTYSHARLNIGTGSVDLPQAIGARISGAAAAVVGWTDFRGGTQINGDIYTVVTR